jgi:hypothetical protein
VLCLADIEVSSSKTDVCERKKKFDINKAVQIIKKVCDISKPA